ncbi:MAG: hypothetical protein LBT66_00060 [Methanobrevibacter sp.]|nr:hypothetical protein [Candidatus Methanovirga meridionalis]
MKILKPLNFLKEEKKILLILYNEQQVQLIKKEKLIKEKERLAESNKIRKEELVKEEERLAKLHKITRL